MSADVTQFSLGAYLLQENDLGDWKPVEYASRKLTEVETCYATVEKEALGVTWSIQ